MKPIQIIISALILALIPLINYAQNVSIPDANFKAALIEDGVDTGGNGEISYAEAELITSMNVSSENIDSLVGIEAFVNLTYLNCSFNSLTSLNLSNNTALTGLTSNNNELTSLDVSNNTALRSMDCYTNQLNSLNVSGCLALIDLYCMGNQLISIDVSTNTSLANLDVRNNPLTTLDLTNDTALTTLYLEDLPSLGNVYVWVLPFPPVGVWISTTINSPNIHFTIHEDIVTIPDSNFKAALISHGVDSNLTGEISYEEAEAIIALDVSESNIDSLIGIEAFVHLIALLCYSNNLTFLDLSSNTMLEDLRCSNNLLSSLNLSNNTSLEYLNCSNNHLTSLDVTSNTDLTYLNCFGDQLTELDISNNTALTDLSLGDMSSLTMVCVWELPFPPAAVNVSAAGSPNIVYSTCDTTTALKNHTTVSGLHVYPNPASNIVYVDIPGSENYMVEISDVTGKNVYTNSLYRNNESIEISMLRKGMYLVRVLNENQIITTKIAIQ